MDIETVRSIDTKERLDLCILLQNPIAEYYTARMRQDLGSAKTLVCIETVRSRETKERLR